jgi:hypothetical protein
VDDVERPKSITKLLSKNDTGETGSKQVGFLVPKKTEILSFFPMLAPNTKNPRALLRFEDEGGSRWDFAFIYYNSKFYGGTRNEYRITRITEFIRRYALKVGDQLTLIRDDDGAYHIRFTRHNGPAVDEKGVLRLGQQWRVIPIREN